MSGPQDVTDDFPTLLDRVGFLSDDVISLCRKWPDGRDGLQAVFTPVSQAPALAAQAAGGDLWFSVCPIRPDIREFVAAEIAAGRRKPGTRGKVEDVVGLPALWVEFDYKPNGLHNADRVWQATIALSEIMGERPAAKVASGGGLHLYWPLEREEGVTHWQAGDVKAIANVQHHLAKWRSQVETVARNLGGAVDPVFDLARILRVPGSLNRKYTPPRAVTLEVTTA